MSDRYEFMEGTDEDGEVIFRIWDNKEMTTLNTEDGKLFGTYSESGILLVLDMLNGKFKPGKCKGN